MTDYNHKKIEQKWQEKWAEEGLYEAHIDDTRPKEYLLVEFPYPSGDGLHVGHVRSYTAMDIIARKHRMEGKNVLYPMGWDAFGLPTENFAVKTGIHPKTVTKQNTDNFRAQLQSLGLSFDWSREINTTDPNYYKWTQWIFLQLFKEGLAYKKNMPINWCLDCKIGLANEEVVDGQCERCGGDTEKRDKEQWMLAITKYADRLVDDLDDVDYWDRIKTQQKNWIGRSSGAEISFKIQDTSHQIPATIPVFTTRPDTLFGATYLVLSPEHEEITNFKSHITNWDEVEAYIKEAKRKSEMERTAEDKEKTGVQLEGITAVNPGNGEEIPVFIADYVLAHYGTGAIMAVPAHDERDFAFAQKYDIPVREVIMPTVTDTVNAPRNDKPTKERHNVHAIVYDPKRNAYLALHSKEHDWKTVVIGGVEDGEDAVEAAKREVREETGYTDLKFECHLGGPVQAGYFAKHKDENRKSITQALYFTLQSEEQVEREDDDGEVIWVAPEDFKQGYMINSELPFWLERLPHKGVCVYTGEGVLVNSGQFDGMDSEEAKQKITAFVGGEMKTTYKLRDWVFSRQRYWGEPIPLIFCNACKKLVEKHKAQDTNHKQNTNSKTQIQNYEFTAGEIENPGWVMDERLPVELPEVEDFMPTESGESPLAKATDWVHTTCPKCGGEAQRETDVMPNWAGSSWYYLRYTDAGNDEAFAGTGALNYWTPVDWYNGGMEHTTLHLLYSRFWHKFLFDQGLVPTKEPYMKRTSHGMILAEGGVKMSKSKGNTINPNDVVDNIGADALRLYEMFMGPFDQAIAWNTEAMVGVRKFLERVWRLKEKVDEHNVEANEGVEAALHRTIKKVSEDIDQLKFNTAVAQMMTLVNKMEKQKALRITDYGLLITILAPFAPHMAEELWEQLGNKGSVHTVPWPAFDPAKIVESEMTIAVQINGKVRDSFSVAAETPEEEIKEKAQALPNARKWLEDGEVKRVIYVPGKLVNIVVSADRTAT